MSVKKLSFPRTTDLPNQTPLFWVEQKDRYLRQLLISDIEEQTSRRLIVYFANRYEGAQIDLKDPAYMAELFADIGDSPVDLLLETAGGLTDAAEAIIALFRNSTNDLRVIVPHSAKSNGTLLCLAAKSILMGPCSELGPIEPMVQNIPCTILCKPEIAQQNFPLHMFGIYALQQSQKLATTLLTDGMMSGRTQEDIENTVKKLSSREVYHSHGSVIHNGEAEELGLKIEYLTADNPLWQRLWLLYCMYEHDCRKEKYLKLFEGRKTSTAIAAPPTPSA